jgi:hypothetical protein
MRNTGRIVAFLLPAALVAGCLPVHPPGQPPVRPHAYEQVALPHESGSVVVVDGGVWTFPHLDPVAHFIGDGSHRIERTIALPGSVTAAAAGDGMVWVLTEAGAPVYRRLDPATGAQLAAVTGLPVGTLAIGFGKVWVTGPDGAVHEIDPATNGVQRHQVQSGGPMLLTIAGAHVWTLGFAEGLVGLDPHTGARTQPWRPGEVIGDIRPILGSAGSRILLASRDAVHVVDPIVRRVIRQVDAPAGTTPVGFANASPDRPAVQNWWLFGYDKHADLFAETPRGGPVADALLARVALDTLAIRITNSYKVPVAEGSAIDGDSVWIAPLRDRRVLHVSRNTTYDSPDFRYREVALPYESGTLAVVSDDVWVFPHVDPVALRIDGRTKRIERTVPLPGSVGEAVGNDDMLWAMTWDPGYTYRRLDPHTGAELARIPNVQGWLPTIAFGDVWAAGDFGEIYRIDAATNTASRIQVFPGGPVWLAVAGSRVWVWQQGQDRVVGVDPATNMLEPAWSLAAVTGRTPWWVAAHGGNLVMSTAGTDELVEVDPIARRVVQRIATPAGLRGESTPSGRPDLDTHHHWFLLGRQFTDHPRGTPAPRGVLSPVDYARGTLAPGVNVPFPEDSAEADGRVWIAPLRQHRLLYIDE